MHVSVRPDGPDRILCLDNVLLARIDTAPLYADGNML